MSKGALIRPFVITVHCVCIMKLFLYDECKELLLMKSAGKPCQLHLRLSEIKLGSSPVEMLHKCTSCKWMPLKAEVVSQHTFLKVSGPEIQASDTNQTCTVDGG